MRPLSAPAGWPPAGVMGPETWGAATAEDGGLTNSGAAGPSAKPGDCGARSSLPSGFYSWVAVDATGTRPSKTHSQTALQPFIRGRLGVAAPDMRQNAISAQGNWSRKNRCGVPGSAVLLVNTKLPMPSNKSVAIEVQFVIGSATFVAAST
jgi:hypothetical protein